VNITFRGSLPTDSVAVTVFEARLMTETELDWELVTYANVPAGFTATSVGAVPTGITATTASVKVFTTETLLLPKFAT
jgi:hypothetical protein